jgi:hypothetical protein
LCLLGVVKMMTMLTMMTMVMLWKALDQLL